MGCIVENIRQGDRAAFRELFEDYYPILCVFAMKYIRDEEQCKDIAQEVLLTYWQNRLDFEDIFKVKGYLYTVARNRCLNIIKREQVDGLYVKEALLEPEYYFEDEVIRQETYLLVRKAVEALPTQMRRIIELAMQGKKNSEIAAEMAIAEGTVHSLKKTAYQKLRSQLQDHFYLLLF
ncbi:MAG: RNA polymerase sigma-70 factor [Odoribacter sp.]